MKEMKKDQDELFRTIYKAIPHRKKSQKPPSVI